MSIDRAALGRRAKRRGNAYENNIAKKLSEYLGVAFRRVPASGGLDLKGDICYKDFDRRMPMVIDTKDNKSLIGAKLRGEISKSKSDAKAAGTADKYMLILRDVKLHEDFALLPLELLVDLYHGKIKFEYTTENKE